MGFMELLTMRERQRTYDCQARQVKFEWSFFYFIEEVNFKMVFRDAGSEHLRWMELAQDRFQC